MVDLVIVSGVSTSDSSSQIVWSEYEPDWKVCIGRRCGALAGAPAVSNITAYIETRPVICRRHHRRCHWRFGRHVCGACSIDETECGKGRNNCGKLLHGQPLRPKIKTKVLKLI